jgi:hypothetical protein
MIESALFQKLNQLQLALWSDSSKDTESSTAYRSLLTERLDYYSDL